MGSEEKCLSLAVGFMALFFICHKTQLQCNLQKEQ